MEAKSQKTALRESPEKTVFLTKKAARFYTIRMPPSLENLLTDTKFLNKSSVAFKVCTLIVLKKLSA